MSAELKMGEALVSVLHGRGELSMVQRTPIRPPSARIGPIDPEDRNTKIEAIRAVAELNDREVPSPAA
jgi:hypothetical protein